MKRDIDHNYSAQGGYAPKVDRVFIELDALGDAELKLMDALEFLNKPARAEFVVSKLRALRTVMARASESADDLDIVMETHGEHLCQYPPDVVAYVVDKTIATKKWFSLVSKLRAKCDELIQFRQVVLAVFERCQNPLLANPPRQTVTADPRLSMSYKELPKSKWLPSHYECWIEDAGKMVALYVDREDESKAAEWRLLIKERETEAASVAYS